MLKKYLAALWADWVARMSGAASVILAFFAAYFDFVRSYAVEENVVGLTQRGKNLDN